jgi:hypothetical protein
MAPWYPGRVTQACKSYGNGVETEPGQDLGEGARREDAAGKVMQRSHADEDVVRGGKPPGR